MDDSGPTFFFSKRIIVSSPEICVALSNALVTPCANMNDSNDDFFPRKSHDKLVSDDIPKDLFDFLAMD